MQALLANQSPVSSIAYSNKMRVIYDGVEQDAELRKYPSGKIYFRTENAHFVPVNEVGVLIPLTKGKSAIVDFEDYERLVAMGKWYINSNGYAVRSLAFKKPCGKRSYRSILMHRVVMNAGVGEFVDHRFGSTLDNRKANLRICSNQENSRNQKIRKDNSSGFKGVYWHNRDCKWVSQIRFEGKKKHLGLFDCPLEAAKSYNRAAIQYYDKFARLNEIPA